MEHIEVIEEFIGERIDKFLSLYYPDKSRSNIQNLIKNGYVTINNKHIKVSYQLKVGDDIFIDDMPIEEVNIVAEDIPLDIIYEDDDLIIVNKPKQMVVHPAPGHYSGTLVNALMYHCKDSLSGINGEMRPGIVHRIDMDTTGSLIVCKNDFSHNNLAIQIKEHSVNRIYEGIVIGNVKEDSGTINAPIARNPKDRKKMAIVKDGRDAITHYEVIERLNGYTHIRFKLETGRTHQIRVHMSSIGHPLLGDNVYGPAKSPYNNKNNPLQGQTLHAKTIGFIHPRSGQYVEFEAPLPDYFVELLKKLSN